jgi:hypothetical protein
MRRHFPIAIGLWRKEKRKRKNSGDDGGISVQIDFIVA